MKALLHHQTYWSSVTSVLIVPATRRHHLNTESSLWRNILERNHLNHRSVVINLRELFVKWQHFWTWQRKPSKITTTHFPSKSTNARWGPTKGNPRTSTSATAIAWRKADESRMHSISTPTFVISSAKLFPWNDSSVWRRPSSSF